MVTDHTYVPQKWSNKKAFVLAAIASAVGIGNIWRFPYMAAQNGGGSFLIPYIIGVFLLSIPLLLLEFIVGSNMALTPINIFKKLNKKLAFLFIIPFFINFIEASYYTVVTGWTTSYFILSILNSVMPFAEFIQTNFSIASTMLILVLLFLIMKGNIKKGIEKLNATLMPLFFASLLLLVIGAALVYGIEKPLEFYLSIDMNYLYDINTWVLGFSQAFFSIGVGWCIMLAYSSYANKDTDMKSAAIVVSVADTLIAVVAGFMIFTIALGSGIPLDSGPSLIFDSLANAISAIPYSNIILIAFFFLLSSAALTSAASLLEVPITTFREVFKITRMKATFLLVLLLLIVSLPSSMSYSTYAISILGMPFLDFLDGVVIGKFVSFGILTTVLYLAWGYKDLEKSSRKLFSNSMAKLFVIGVRYLIPAFILIFSIMQFL